MNKPYRQPTLLFFLAVLLCACQGRRTGPEEGPSALAEAIVSEVRGSVLPFWTDYAPAPDGGFYGTLLRDGTPQPDAPRSGVLNARILWSFSAAARTWGDTLCLRLADRAQRELISTFIDPQHGGVFWLTAPDGSVVNGTKYAYALTYGIYGLAEHYLATGNTESLEAALDLFRTLEENGRDPQHDGYIEAFTVDWKPLDKYDKDAPKTMNAHLHVLEAYTLLYECRPDPKLRERLEYCTRLFMDTIYDPGRKHFNQYFDRGTGRPATARTCPTHRCGRDPHLPGRRHDARWLPALRTHRRPQGGTMLLVGTGRDAHRLRQRLANQRGRTLPARGTAHLGLRHADNEGPRIRRVVQRLQQRNTYYQRTQGQYVAVSVPYDPAWGGNATTN